MNTQFGRIAGLTDVLGQRQGSVVTVRGRSLELVHTTTPLAVRVLSSRR
jgi:hypothetical protein